MRVKCIKIYNEQTQEYQTKSSWLTVGKEYVVLEILVRPEKEVLYRLVSDNENILPALFDAKQFEIISDKIPSNWIVEQLSSGRFIFSPKAWRRPGFWEDCYDGDLLTLNIYKHEARIIYREEGL